MFSKVILKLLVKGLLSLSTDVVCSVVTVDERLCGGLGGIFLGLIAATVRCSTFSFSMTVRCSSVVTFSSVFSVIKSV